MGLNARTGELIAVKQVQLTTEEDMEQADRFEFLVSCFESNMLRLFAQSKD